LQEQVSAVRVCRPRNEAAMRRQHRTSFGRSHLSLMVHLICALQYHCQNLGPRSSGVPNPKEKETDHEKAITRDRLAELLNEDLAREYQAIIAYVVYSQVLKGATYMNIADQLQLHAAQELQHALTLSRQIDYLGKMPTVTAKQVKTSEDAKQMLRFDLDNENETVRNYRDRVRQCEALGEFALAEQIRQILMQEQDHQIDLATALGEDVPDMSQPAKKS
jgi:bacterioferritin